MLGNFLGGSKGTCIICFTGTQVAKPEYKETTENPLINLDGNAVDLAAMYAAPIHNKSAPRTPETELTTNELFVNKTDGLLDKNRESLLQNHFRQTNKWENDSV